MNEQFKGTPGPWLRDGQDNGAQWNIDDTEGFAVGMSFQRPFDKSYVERTANANLIAAAPELLEALQRMTKLYESLLSDCGVQHKDLTDSAHAAINKALGKGTDK